jgi:hypothetical protein
MKTLLAWTLSAGEVANMSAKCSLRSWWTSPRAGSCRAMRIIASNLPADPTPSHCAPRHWCATIPVIVTYRQEVSPMNAVSETGAPLQSTIARLS